MLRIRSVEVVGILRVKLELTNGQVVERDLSSLAKGPAFATVVADAEQFRSVRVSGGTLVWDCGADLCPDMVIWGTLPPTPEPARAPETLAPGLAHPGTDQRAA